MKLLNIVTHFKAVFVSKICLSAFLTFTTKCFSNRIKNRNYTGLLVSVSFLTLCLTIFGCSKSSGSQSNINETETGTDIETDSSESGTETGTDIETDNSESGTETSTDIETDSSESGTETSFGDDTNNATDSGTESESDANSDFEAVMPGIGGYRNEVVPAPEIEDFEEHVFSGANYYVDPNNGSDSADGSDGTPFKSIDYALTVVSGGDTINLLPGTYPQLVLKPFTGPTTPVRIAGTSSDEIFFSEETHIYNWDTAKANLQFENITFQDGFYAYKANSIRIFNSILNRKAPLVGSKEAIERAAAGFRQVEDIVLANLDITQAPVGITLDICDNVYIVDNTIHDLTHDGIQVISVHSAVIKKNHIYGLNDGVDDNSGVDWNKHCDAMHFYQHGADIEDLRTNDGIIIDSNIMHDLESQDIQFNNYGNHDDPAYWNKNIVFRNNVFGPCHNPYAFNAWAPIQNLYVYNNTFTGGESTYTTPDTSDYMDVQNKTVVSSGNNFRVRETTMNAYVFNNFFSQGPGVSQATIEFFDYNIIKNPTDSYAMPRNTEAYDDTSIYFNSYSNWSGKDSSFIDKGVAISQINESSVDIDGNSRKYIPDVGAYEYGDNSVLSETITLSPIVHDDPYLLIKDDFEDCNFRTDYALTQPGISIGASWFSLETNDEDAQFTIQASDDTSHVSQYVCCLTGIANAGSFIFIDTPQLLEDYDAGFTILNAYAEIGSGVVVQYKDSNNYTYIDFGSASGSVISVTNGSVETISQHDSLKVPEGPVNFSIEMRNSTLTVSWGTTEKLEVNNLPNLQNVFGIIHNVPDPYYRLLFDNIELQPIERK